MSRKNRNEVMLVNIFFKIFSQFFKIRVEFPFKVLQNNWIPAKKCKKYSNFYGNVVY